MTNNSFRPLNDEPIKITHVLEILYRQKWAFLLTFLFVIAITAAYSLIQKKTYEATTSIIVQDSPANVTLGLATQEVKTDNLQNQLEVLQSRDLINRVVDKLINRVYLNPGAPKTDTMMIIKKAKRAAGINDLQSSVVVENMIKEFKNSMDIDYKKGSEVVRFSYRSQNPFEAFLIANFYAETYNERDLQRSRANSTELRAFLEKQSQTKSNELAKSDSALQNYMQTNSVSELDLAANILNNKVAGLQSEIENNDIEYQRNKMLLDNYKKQLQELGPSVTKKLINVDDIYIKELQQVIAKKEAERDISKIISGPEAQRPEYRKEMYRNSRTIDSLRAILEVRTKNYVKNSISNYSVNGGGQDDGNLISQLSGKIQDTQVKLSSLELSRRALADNFSKYNSQLNQLPRQSITLAKLQRERAFNEKVYLKIGEKYEDAVLAEKSTFGQIEILDKAAIPLEPVSPNLKLNLILGGLSGLSLGLVLAFVLHFVNNKIHTPRDIEYLGFRLLSTIPRLQLESRGNTKLLTEGVGNQALSLVNAKNPNSEIYESYLRLGINLAYSLMDRKCKSLLITSAGQGAGKSATALNVSITLANLGKNVLLVDTDIRRPVVHKFFNKPMTPGLTDYLLEQKKFDEVVQQTVIKGLDIITCGGKLLNPSLLLSSVRMQALVTSETSYYDFIIYDAPPLNPVTDAIHLAKIVDDVILVVRADKTQVDELRRANQILDQINISVSGVVLNDFDVSKSPFSGKHYGYYSYSEDSSPKKKKNKDI